MAFNQLYMDVIYKHNVTLKTIQFALNFKFVFLVGILFHIEEMLRK